MKKEEILKYLDKEVKNIKNEADRLIAEERKKVFLKEYQGEDKVVAWEEIAEEIKTKPREVGMSTGLVSLDKEIGGGLKPKQLVVLSASIKSGKTSYALDLLENMKLYNPLLISLEQDPRELIEKIIFDWHKEVPQIYSPKVIDGIVDLDWLEKRILESYLKFGTKMVVIDHLDFVAGDSNIRRDDLNIQHIALSLKNIAKKLDVCILLIAHLNKQPAEEKPTYYQIANAKAIPALADKVLLLWQECYKNDGVLEYTGMTILNVAVDRQTGSRADIVLKFNKGHYEEVDKSFKEVQKEFRKNLINNEEEF